MAQGPAFLWERESPDERDDEISFDVSPDDPELKKVHVLATKAQSESRATISERLERFSEWHRAKRAIAICMKLKASIQRNSREPLQEVKKTRDEGKATSYQPPSVEEMRRAELAIIKSVQKGAFAQEIKILNSLEVHDDVTSRDLARKRNSSMKRTSSLYRLDPFLDENGLLRVGGRIRHAFVSYDVKHPVIIPSKGHVTTLLVRHHHERTSHQGRGITLNDLRSHGYLGAQRSFGNFRYGDLAQSSTKVDKNWL